MDEAYYRRGLAYSNLNQYQRAIQDFDEAIRLNPRVAETYNNRGSAYNMLGQHQRALQDYNEALRIDPQYTRAYAKEASPSSICAETLRRRLISKKPSALIRR